MVEESRGGYGEWSKNGPWGVWRMVVENSPDSHKPVEIGDLGSQGDSKAWGSQEGPKRPTGSARGDPSTRKELFHETGWGG